MGPTTQTCQHPKAKTRLIHDPMKNEASPIRRQVNHPTRRRFKSSQTTPKYQYWTPYPKTAARPKPRVQPQPSSCEASTLLVLPDTTGPGFDSVEDKQPVKIKIEQNPDDVPCGSKSLLPFPPDDTFSEEIPPVRIKVEQNPDLPCGSKSLLLFPPEDTIPEEAQPVKIKVEQNPDLFCESTSLLLFQPEDTIPEETQLVKIKVEQDPDLPEDNNADQVLSEQGDDRAVLIPTKPYLPKRLPCVLNGDYHGKPAPLDEIGIYANGMYSTVHAANKRLRIGATLAMRLRPFQQSNEPKPPAKEEISKRPKSA